MSNTSFNQLRSTNKLTALMAAGALGGSLLLNACTSEPNASSNDPTTDTRPSFQPKVVPEKCVVTQEENGNFTAVAKFLNRATSGLKIAEVELVSDSPIGIGESWDDKKLSIWDNTAYDGQTVSPDDSQYHYSFSSPLGEQGDVLHVLGASDSDISCTATRQ